MKTFYFTYHFGGRGWVISIRAKDAAEAKEKIKAVALARYEGELAAVPAIPILIRLAVWLKTCRVWA